ncbi:MAG: hypothetical protein HQK96_11955 [Nitrospirae bacterium]|nr:hypothetical protein [Nitrospirota bacterium]
MEKKRYDSEDGKLIMVSKEIFCTSHMPQDGDKGGDGFYWQGWNHSMGFSRPHRGSMKIVYYITLIS